MNLDWTIREVAWPIDPSASAAALSASDELAWLDTASAASGGLSLLCATPIATLEQRDDRERATLCVGGRISDTDSNGWRLWRRALDRLPHVAHAPTRLAPGWVGYIGYHMARFLERLPTRSRDATELPWLRFALFDRGIVLDHGARRAYAVSISGLRESLALSRADDDWIGRWDSAATIPDQPCPRPCVRSEYDLSAAEYEGMVRQAIDYVAAGDIYQVNLAQRVRLTGMPDAFATYARLRVANPAPNGALLRWPGGAVASVSPELFLRVDGSDVLTSPIKGTQPRTGDAALDAMFRRKLLESGKEAAELAMIVDLHRNDLGRVCEYGSVRVLDPRRIETHPRVIHTVADVVGRLARGRDALDLLMAAFPAGSVTGVPKIRAMEIIDELEPCARGVYTGAIGVLGLDGRMTLSVAIRTVQLFGNSATLHVGGGIVADSEPREEYEETLAKARGILEALNIGSAGACKHPSEAFE